MGVSVDVCTEKIKLKVRKWGKLELLVDFHLGETRKADLGNIYLEGAELESPF